ncbi:MAG: lysophospholipase [Coriobacteriales bacterium]|jgi:alpha-beta hydrolase superfamily lysophospholipase|nr:lysophospholipase [Coriobacteriales bacterium]
MTQAASSPPTPAAATETELGYLSHDGTTQIRALLWEPAAVAAVVAGSAAAAAAATPIAAAADATAAADAAATAATPIAAPADAIATATTTPIAATATSSAVPCGIVQIAHGMAEHIERYRPFARFLAQNGFVVCGNDHLGHGKSVGNTSDWGHLPAKTGKDILIADVRQLHDLIAARYPTQTPYILFGHSMGSFIVRCYAAWHGKGLAAAIVCGTGQQPLALSRAGHALAVLLGMLHGETHRSTFVDSMGVGGYAKAYPKARTPLDWLSYDEANVDAYIEDPACGFMFSTGGYAALTALMAEVVTNQCARAIPINLPLLFIAGADDLVGAKGTGVQRAANQLRAVGHSKLTVKLYPAMRHEILLETKHQQVFNDIRDWLQEVL